MELLELGKTINKHVDELDYFSARKYIESNLDQLEKNKRVLNSNAREILKFLIDQQKAGHKALTRKEMLIINAINDYSRQFDLRGIKMLLKNNTALFVREDIEVHLNKDAQEILTGMGAIKQV